MSETSLEQERKYAQQQVERFVRRFEPSYKKLAYYAALPLVLTPELLNYLRNKFLPVEVDWVAEVDLLLSDICRPVGYEQYAMEPAVRAYLMEEMEEVLGKKQMEAVARLLIGYIKHLSQTNSYISSHELRAQQWAAMVCLDDKRQEAVGQISRAYRECIEAAEGDGNSLLNRAEMERLSRITQELAPQLTDYPTLLAYAEVVKRLDADPTQVSDEVLNRSWQVEDVELWLPTALVPYRENLSSATSQLPNRQTFTFEEATIVFEDETEITPSINLQPFEFEVAVIELKQSRRKTTELAIKRYYQQARGFSEDLGNDIQLEMVAIPQGSFMMGSPKDEEGHQKDESPQHQVTLKSFFMGKYPVTQAQWEAVAALPQINRELNPDPSRFKGANRPVERVSWLDAVEFCERLTQQTGKPYRLPSEAEWEYACRAGTTTPFHFGETITTDLANYNGNYIYGAGSKGIYREETTPVGSFGVANAFGLYDMHGNVWEWCADHWHSSYKGAPDDGSAWVDEEQNDNDNYSQIDRLLRGGSWFFNPASCRSAIRLSNLAPVDRLDDLGFRLVCAVAWTPSP